MISPRTYAYVIEAPGRAEDGQVIHFTYGQPGVGDPPRMSGLEPFQLKDGAMARIRFLGQVRFFDAEYAADCQVPR